MFYMNGCFYWSERCKVNSKSMFVYPTSCLMKENDMNYCIGFAKRRFQKTKKFFFHHSIPLYLILLSVINVITTACLFSSWQQLMLLNVIYSLLLVIASLSTTTHFYAFYQKHDVWFYASRKLTFTAISHGWNTNHRLSSPKIGTLLLSLCCDVFHFDV